MMKITKINQSNIQLFENVYKQRSSQALNQEQINNSHLHCFVIHDGGISYGWVTVVLVPKIGKTNQVYYVDELYVLPAHRKKGFASKLLNHVTQVFNDKTLRLYVELGNQTAIKRYQEAGFELINKAYYMIRSNNL